MAFFFFGKKFDLGQGRSLSQIPLFSTLSGLQLRLIEKKVRLVEFKKGDWIYRKGEEGKAFYVIVSGRVRIYQETEEAPRILSTLYRGDYFGETSLLTEAKRSTSAQAQNDAVILQIDKDDFHEVLKDVPPLSIHLSRTMGVRLSRQNARIESKEEAKIVSVYHMRSGIGKTTFIHNLAASLAKETNRNTVILSLNMPDKGRPLYEGEPVDLNQIDFSENSDWETRIIKNENGFSTLSIEDGAPTEETISHFVSLMSHLLRNFNYVMVDLPNELNNLVIKVMEQSDVVYLLTDTSSEPLERTREMLSDLKDYFRFTKENLRILAVEFAMPGQLTLRQIEKLIDFPIFRSIPYDASLKDMSTKDRPLVLKNPDCAYARTLRYLARELGDVLVGLALGSGAAYGLAHIGVIKALEEEGIPVDVVAGSSIGAFIGALWTAGIPIQKIAEESKELKGWKAFLKLVGFRDFVIPPKGFFKGRRAYHYLKSLIGDIQFRDLKKPLLIPTANLFTSEEVVFREGEVARAVRASIAIPGIVRPVLVGRSYLTDGGIIDPLPVQLLQEAGCRKVIAVNVLLSPEDFKEKSALFLEKKKETETKLQEKWMPKKMKYFFSKKIEKKRSTNIFNVLMNTIQFMEYTLAKAQSMDADIVLHPVVPGSNWADFFDPEKFIEMGELKAQEMMPEIKKLVEEN